MTRTYGLRRALAAAVTTAAALATTLTSAPAASADEYRCPAGSFCVFQDPGFRGQMKIISASRPTLGDWDDTISSYFNRSGKWAIVYLGASYAWDGGQLTIGPHQRSGEDLGPGSTSGADNAISSIRVGGTQWEVETGQAWIDWDTSTTPRPHDLPEVSRFGDLDNDGVGDLLERGGDGRLWFLDGVRDDSGETRGSLVGGGWNAMTALVRHGDQDGDGNEDVYARDRAGALWLYPGDGKGAFKPRRLVGGGWNTMKEIEAVGDLTGDGRRDLVARDTAGVLWTYPGDGRGRFGARARVGGGWGAMNALAAPGDLNRDGRSDLVARDGSRALWLYPGDGRGAFGARVRLPYAWPSGIPLVATGDVTGDGLGDILRTIQGSSLYVYPNNGAGGLAAPVFETAYDITAPSVHIF